MEVEMIVPDELGWPRLKRLMIRKGLRRQVTVEAYGDGQPCLRFKGSGERSLGPPAELEPHIQLATDAQDLERRLDASDLLD